MVAKKKTTSKSKPRIPKINPEVELDLGDDRTLDWYREKLNPVEQLCWDKAIDGLNSTKAMGKWVDFMKVLQELASLAEIADDDLEVDLCLDPVATSEIEEARAHAC